MNVSKRTRTGLSYITASHLPFHHHPFLNLPRASVTKDSCGLVEEAKNGGCDGVVVEVVVVKLIVVMVMVVMSILFHLVSM